MDDKLMRAKTQAEAKADSPAFCANPTTCTKGMEWQMQQKKLMPPKVQNPCWRKMSRQSAPTELAAAGGRGAPAAGAFAGSGDGGAGSAP